MGLYNYSVEHEGDTSVIVLDFSSLPLGKLLNLRRFREPNATECTNWILAMVSVGDALFSRFKDDVESVTQGKGFCIRILPAGQLVEGLLGNVVHFLDAALDPS